MFRVSILLNFAVDKNLKCNRSCHTTEGKKGMFFYNQCLKLKGQGHNHRSNVKKMGLFVVSEL